MLCFASLLAGSMREGEAEGGTKEWFGLEWTASLLGVAAFLPLLSFPSGHLDLTTPACCLLLRFLFEPYKSR